MREMTSLLTSTEGKPVPLAGVRVSGEILGRGARVTVAQRFRNRERSPIEAVYRFPLPEAAAICGFSATVAGRRITGSVEERDKAFEMYDDALTRGDGAYLLDEERPNIFTLSVGSLPPGAEAVVEVRYVALLDQRGEEVRFVLPTTISPRYLPAGAADEDGIPAEDRIHPEYASSVPYGLAVELAVRDAAAVASVESPSHPVNVSLGGEAIVVRFASETAAMDRDFVLTITRRAKEAGRVWRHADGRGTWLQLDFSPEEPEEAQGDHRRTEAIFVLDCSGSMQGDSIAQAKRALEVSLKALEAGASFNVVRFGSSFEALFPQPRQYSEESLQAALAWLAAVDANLGGTEVLAPLAAVYRAPVGEGAARSVVLLTDGEVGNEAEVMALVRGGASATRFFCVGIGAGPNDHLVRGLARAGGGTCAFIYPGERIEPKVLGIFREAVGARISGLKVEWGAGAGAVAGAGAQQAPAVPVAAFGQPLSAFARLGVGATRCESVTVAAQIDGKPVRWEIRVVEAGTEAGATLPLLWARERIRDLEESQGLEGRGSRQARRKSEAWKQEVVALAKEFGLSSDLTSWVAIEERENKDKQTGELVLRKVPTLVTVGWHGVGSVRAPGAQAVPTSAQAAVMRADLSQVLGANAPAPKVRMRKMAMFGSASSRASSRTPVPSEPPASSREMSRARPPAESNEVDLLMALLALQRADGGFDLSDETLKALGVNPAVVAKAAAVIESRAGGREAARRVLHTALVLAVLEERFGEERETWFRAVRKSRAWLKTATDGWGAVLDGAEVGRWARARVAAA
jgi:Ca-activated chloride channel family protein